MRVSRFTRAGAALAAGVVLALGHGGFVQAGPPATTSTQPLSAPPTSQPQSSADPNNPANSIGPQSAPADEKKGIKATSKEQIADALVQAKTINLDCAIGKVRFINEGDVKGKDGKSSHVQVYEVSCANSYGYVLQGPKGGSATITTASSCPSMAQAAIKNGKKDEKAITCLLPENANVNGQLQGILSKIGSACSVQSAKWIGVSSTTHDEGFEVACAPPSPGYVMYVPQVAGRTAYADNCLAQSYHCTLTPPAQQTAWLQGLAAKAGKTCDITQPARYVGSDRKDRTAFLEVACNKGVGFILQLSANGEFQRAIDCAEATWIAGGCTLTDKATIAASSNKGFGDRLKAAGVPCTVQQARLIGQTKSAEGPRDVVEYQCSDRPAGLIVAFPSSPTQKVDVVDCFDGHHFGTKCEFTTHDDQLAILTKAMTAGGKTCKVSDFLNLGSYDDGKVTTTAFELACGSDPGYIAFMPLDYSKASDVQTCPQAAKTAAKTGLSCTLPGNH